MYRSTFRDESRHRRKDADAGEITETTIDIVVKQALKSLIKSFDEDEQALLLVKQLSLALSRSTGAVKTGGIVARGSAETDWTSNLPIR